MIRIMPCRFTVPFEEIAKSPSLRIAANRDESHAARTLQCAGVYHYQLVKELLGYTEFSALGVVYHRPHTITIISPFMIATTVDVNSFDDKVCGQTIDGLNVYETVRLTVRYEAVSLRDVGSTQAFDKYGNVVSVTEDIRPASEFLTLPTEGLFWGKGEDKVPLEDLHAPAMAVEMYEWIYNIRNAKKVPDELIFTHPGKINSKPVTSRAYNKNFPAGTLLCGNPEVRQEITPDGGQTFDITLRYTFSYNGIDSVSGDAIGWNYYPHVVETEIKWERITDGTSDVTFYKEENFGEVIV